jgi:hypothetical protein
VVSHHSLYDTPPNWNWKTKHSKFQVQKALCIFVSVLEMRLPLTAFTVNPVPPHVLMDFMVSLPCITVYQYSETSIIHCLLNLLRSKSLYMFRVLLAHPQEVLHNSTWYTTCVLCQLAAPGLERNWCSQLT